MTSTVSDSHPGFTEESVLPVWGGEVDRTARRLDSRIVDASWLYPRQFVPFSFSSLGTPG